MGDIRNMKQYKVYYIIKENNHGYLNRFIVEADNQKRAFLAVKNVVKKETGKHAFHITCKEPIENKYGLEYDGMIYTRYNKLLGRLW